MSDEDSVISFGPKFHYGIRILFPDKFLKDWLCWWIDSCSALLLYVQYFENQQPVKVKFVVCELWWLLVLVEVVEHFFSVR